jgi:hypothetical protein
MPACYELIDDGRLRLKLECRIKDCFFRLLADSRCVVNRIRFQGTLLVSSEPGYNIYQVYCVSTTKGRLFSK